MHRLIRLSVPVGVIGSVSIAHWIHQEWRGEVGSGPVGYALLVVALLVASVAFGIPDEPHDWQPAIVYSFGAALTGTGAIAVIRIFEPTIIPRFVLVFVAVASFLVFLMACMLTLRSKRRSEVRDRVLAVIDGEEASVLAADAARSFPRPEKPFTLVGVLSRADCEDDGLTAAVDAHKVSVLVLGPLAQLDDGVITQAAALHESGLRIRTSTGFYEEWFGKLPVSEIDRLSLLTDISSVHGTRFGSAKRLIDLTFGSIGLLATLLVTPLVLVGNAFGNRGPLFFRQQRIGLGGADFTIMKFRTMRVGADISDDTTWTSPDDERITPFGRFLRRTHLDELPQSFNMVGGDLSLVGPRPEQRRYVEQLQEKVSVYSVRHVVKPGLTGWAQVKFRYGATEADAIEKLQYDLYYVRHQSLTLDVRIVSRTIRRMIFARGR